MEKTEYFIGLDVAMPGEAIEEEINYESEDFKVINSEIDDHENQVEWYYFLEELPELLALPRSQFLVPLGLVYVPQLSLDPFFPL